MVRTGGGMGDAFALGDSGQAAEMEPGAIIQLVFTAGTDFGGKGKVGGSPTYRRVITVERRKKDGHVLLKVSFVAGGHETTYVFELDPADKETFDEAYHEILAANEPSKLTALQNGQRAGKGRWQDAR